MFKITLSDTITNKHQKYFKKSVLDKLPASKDIVIIPYDASNSQEVYDAENIKEIFRNFVDYICIQENSGNKISTGSPYELSVVKTEVEQKFAPLIVLFEQKIVRVNDGKLINLKDYILNLFGYEKFAKAIFYQYLKDSACVKLKEERYNKAVQLEMVEMLCSAFPEETERIRGPLCLEGLTANEFENELKRLSAIGIAIYNFDQLSSDNTDEPWNAYAFVFKSGLRVCPYCNRQYITPVLTPDGMVRADLDHILSKDKHPYLSISLYNLLPTCQQCNQSLKGTRNIEINPYEENLNSCFNFEMDEIGTIQTKTIGENPRIQEYLDVFKLALLYNYHKNQGVELAKKRVAYPESYITQLYEKNNKYFKDETAFRELIFGIFTSEERINEEAFSKFRRDIAGQLGIIQKEDSTQLLEKLKTYLVRLCE